MRTDLSSRAKLYAIKIIHFVQTLPSNSVGKVMGNLLLKSGTSAGANYLFRKELNQDHLSELVIIPTSYFVLLTSDSSFKLHPLSLQFLFALLTFTLYISQHLKIILDRKLFNKTPHH